MEGNKMQIGDKIRIDQLIDGMLVDIAGSDFSCGRCLVVNELTMQQTGHLADIYFRIDGWPRERLQAVLVVRFFDETRCSLTCFLEGGGIVAINCPPNDLSFQFIWQGSQDIQTLLSG